MDMSGGNREERDVTLNEWVEQLPEVHSARKEWVALRAALAAMIKERDEARGNARILAHSYEHDSRPPDRVVRDSLAYPVYPKGADGEAKGKVE
jgi:hypothetical protein